MAQKICSRCKMSKDSEKEFNIKSAAKDGRQPYCKVCSSIAWAEHFPEERRQERNKAHKENMRNTISLYLKQKCCDLCGSHVKVTLYPPKKISDALSRKYSIGRLEELLSICIVVCKKCAKEAKEAKEDKE